MLHIEMSTETKYITKSEDWDTTLKIRFKKHFRMRVEKNKNKHEDFWDEVLFKGTGCF